MNSPAPSSKRLGSPPKPRALSRAINTRQPPTPSATSVGFWVCTTMFSAPINAMVSATRASMYSACGRSTPGDRERQGQAVADGESGDHEHQVAQAPRDQHQPQQKGHVIDAGEDVHHSHADEFEEARALQAASLAAGHLHGAVFGA